MTQQDDDNELYVIEYSDSQKCFHWEPRGETRRPNHGSGWETLTVLPRSMIEEYVKLKEEEFGISKKGKTANSKWRRTRLLVLRRDDYHCLLCGRGTEHGAVLEAGHILARAKGGSDEMDNLKTMCYDCNHGMRTESP